MAKQTITVRVPGTTANCGPGFDSVGIACTVYNELDLTLKKQESLSIVVHGEGCDSIACDGRNIVWKSIQALLSRTGENYRGAEITMRNQIPLSRGLGSSAAAIVSGLAAANAAIGGVFSRQDIFQMATDIEGHPDNVAPAVFGGVTLSLMQEGRAETLPFVPERPLRMVVAVPNFNLPTKLARKALPAKVPFEDAVFNVSRTALLVGALCKGEYRYLRQALDDRLHQPYRAQLVPGMPEVLAAARENGAYGAVLSGAGPCLIAFADQRFRDIGAAMTAAFLKNGIEAQALVLDIDTQGVQVLS